MRSILCALVCLTTICVVSSSPAQMLGDGGPGYSGPALGDVSPQHGARIVLLSPTTTGPLSATLVLRTVRRHLGELRMCYAQQLRANPRLAGTVTVEFVIGPDGATGAFAARSQNIVGEPAASLTRLRDCVENRLRSWTFPSAVGLTRVAQPVTFSVR